MNKHNYKLIFIVLITILLSANTSSAFTPLSDLCAINCQNWTLYNRLANVSELITTTKEIDHGLPEEYNITLTAVYYESYGTISQLDFEIQGNEFPSPVTISSYNYGNFTNLSSGQKWTNIVVYEDNSCPTFDMGIDFFVVDPLSEWSQMVLWHLYVNHYKYEMVYVPTPTPSPTPSPTPTPQPNITYAPTYTNYSYDTETQQESWTEYSNETVGNWTTSIDSVFNAIDAPIVGMRTHIQSVNTSLSQFNSTIHMNLLVMFVPTIIDAIPEKLQALVTLFFIFLIILIILGRV